MSDPRYITAADLDMFREQERQNTRRMIDDAFTVYDQKQEKRWRDLEGTLLRNVKKAINAAMEPYAREQQNAVVRQALIESTLFGDKTRDGVLDKMEQLKGEVSTQIGQLTEEVHAGFAELSGRVQIHDHRISHFEQLESYARRGIAFGARAVRTALGTPLLVWLARLIGLIAAILPWLAVIGFAVAGTLQFIFFLVK